MRCTLCDRCKKIITEPTGSRTVFCARPMRGAKTDVSTASEKTSDIVWSRDLCVECAGIVESYIDNEPDVGGDATDDQTGE
jgi:hypothetical protein